MEIVQALAGYFIVFVVMSALMQLAFAYALQVLSEKNELPEFAAFLSWIPILNLYPLIRCGGGDFRRFTFGAIGCVVLVAAGGAIAAAIGPLPAGIAVGVAALVVVIYMVKIVMETAHRRGIVKWIGLLAFVPGLNILVYPYIALHDGFRAPNKIGLVIGLLLALGPIPGQIKLLDALSESAGSMQVADETGDLPSLIRPGVAGGGGSVGDLGDLSDLGGSVGPAIEISAQLAAIGGMDASDPAQADAMRSQIEDVRTKLSQNAEGLGPEAVGQLEALLQQVDERLAARPGENDVAGENAEMHGAAPIPVDAKPPLSDSIARQGDAGYDVPTSVPCPVGAVTRGASPPEGKVRWCSREGGDLKHGWYTEWHDNGVPAVAGEYRDGLKVGVFTRWYPSGGKRVQAEFAGGLQDGAMIAWNESGAQIHESRFADGELASR